MSASRMQPSADLPTLDSPLGEEAPEPEIDLKALNASPEGKALVDWIHQQYTKCDAARQNEKRRWYLNLALYGGDQYAQFTTSAVQASSGAYIHSPAQQRAKKKKVINRIRSIIRTELSRLLSQKPSAVVIPASSEDIDLFAARAAEQVWESVSNRCKAFAAFSESIFWTALTGNGFIKTYWDASKVDPINDIEGDFKYESISPFNLFLPDLRIRDIEEQPYVLNLYTKSIDWLESFYAEELDGVKLTASTVTSNTLMEEAYAKLSNASESQADSCMLYEIWVKPGGCKYLPNGGLVTLVDKYIVQYSADGIPYRHKEYPFTHFPHVPTAKFYSDSIIIDLEDPQREYNDVRQLIADTRNKMAKVQLTAPKGSISAAKMTNEIGLVVEYRPGFAPPQPIPLSELPSYVMQEPELILRDMEDISGQHQVSKGNVPPGVTAATAISYLQERDDSYLVHTYQGIEAGWEKMARQTLNLAVQYWDVRRLVKVVGDDGAFDTMMLMGSDLVNGTDIRTEAGSALAESRSARQARIMDLMVQGFIPGDKGLELLEIGGAQKMLDQLQVDRRQAQRENIKLKSLTPEDISMYAQAWENAQQQADMSTVDPSTQQPLEMPPVITVNTWDNHAVHIEVHNQFRRGQAFEQCSPEVKHEFEMHIQMHKQVQMDEQLQQMLGQIPSDGSTPGVQMGGGLPQSPDGEQEGSNPMQETGAAEMPPAPGLPQNEQGAL